MNFRFSKHADREMERRGISRDIVEGVLAAPAQPEHGVMVHYHGGWRSTESLILCASWERNGLSAHGGDGLPDEQDREILEDNMKVTYDPEVDVLLILFRGIDER